MPAPARQPVLAQRSVKPTPLTTSSTPDIAASTSKSTAKSTLADTHAVRGGQQLVRDRRRRERHLQLASELEGEVQILLHHVAVEPDLVRVAEDERAAVGDHRRGDHAREHHLDCPLARDAALLREQHALAEGEHLHRE